MFIAKNIDSDVILFVDFVYLVDCYWKFNSTVIQIFDVFSITFLDPLRVIILRVQISDMTPSEAFIVIIFMFIKPLALFLSSCGSLM